MENNKVPLRIALIASHRLHLGPDSLMLRFAREFERFLIDHHIYATKGLWSEISDCGLLRGHHNIKLLRHKRDGGILEVTAMVVEDNIDVVIFLIDPTDMASLFPDCAALKRECVANNKFFLSTYASAREWATLTWSIPGDYILTDKEFDGLQRSRNIKFAADLSNQTIALIAHDRMKVPIIQFADKHRDLLDKFGAIIGTGTTATLLKGEEKEGELDNLLEGRSQEEKEDLQKAIDEVRQRNLRLSRMQKMRSGPRGGDVQIARRVMDGRCDKVIFFEDPFIARPHEPDIQLLERTCQICGESVMCFSDPVSADLWAEAWKRPEGNYHEAAPVTLARALEKYLSRIARHTVHVILSPHCRGEKATMRSICRIAALYLTALITRRGADKNAIGEELRLVVPWGTIMGQLVGELGKVVASQRNPKKLPNLVTLPMGGLMNCENPSVEANRLAEEIKELFGGNHYPIPISNFVSTPAVLGSQVKEVLQQFGKTDITLLHGKPIFLPGNHFGTVSRAPTNPEMVQDVYQRGAICEISGLFLNKMGKEIQPSKFQRIGMDYQSLRSAGSNPECQSIFLIGTPNKDIRGYIGLAKALFEAQFPSVLITDVTFARHLLSLEDVSAMSSHK